MKKFTSFNEANIVKVVDGLVDKIANSGNFKGAIAWQEYEDTRKKNAKYDDKSGTLKGNGTGTGAYYTWKVYRGNYKPF